MIRFDHTIGDAYVHPARNVAMPSLPGREVKFLQGHAQIRDGRDMVAMLRRPDVKIVLTPYALNWWSAWVNTAQNIRAEVIMPPQPDPNPEPEDEDEDEDEVPKEPEPEPLPRAKRRSSWDLPRDPKTGRILPRSPAASGANSTVAGT